MPPTYYVNHPDGTFTKADPQPHGDLAEHIKNAGQMLPIYYLAHPDGSFTVADHQSPEQVTESDAELLLRELACFLGVGGYNVPTVNVKVFREKLYEGIRICGAADGVAARDLAEHVLGMGMATERGMRARELARQVLCIAQPAPVVQQPLTDEQIEAAFNEWYGGGVGLGIHSATAIRAAFDIGVRTASPVIGGQQP